MDNGQKERSQERDDHLFAHGATPPRSAFPRRFPFDEKKPQRYYASYLDDFLPTVRAGCGNSAKSAASGSLSYDRQQGRTATFGDQSARGHDRPLANVP